jgi:hypothetical protein
MPLGETPLPQATITAIRQWITDGAPNAPAAAAAAASMFAVQTTAPLNKATVKAPLARIVVTFTQDVDAALVNDTTITLERIDSGSAAASGAEIVSATTRLAPSNPAVLLITPNTRLEPGVYRVTLRGSGGGALANVNAATLSANTSFEFTVEPAQ